MPDQTHQKLDIVVLGGGFAGAYCARSACKELKALRVFRKLRIGLISEENYMVFQPMLPEVAGASISPRHVANPLRLLCKGAEVFRGQVKQIKWPEKRLLLHAGAFSGEVEIEFDHLVIALGAAVDLSRIPGMPEHGFVLQTVGDAMRLRTTLISRIEEANLETRPDIKRRLLTFVVVGGGYSGVETAGQILDLFRSIHGYYSAVSLEDLKVWLIHGRDHLLPTLNRQLGAYCARQLERRGLKLLLNKRVKAVTAHRVTLDDETTIEANTVICTVGNAPHPVVSELIEAADLAADGGRPVAEANGRLRGHTHLWGAGDGVAVPYVKGGYCPPTAQFAMRQGILLGKNLARALHDQPLLNFNFKGFGEMASIGRRTGVADIMGFRFSGFVAWWMWRTVYLTKLPRLDRKLRVMLDWTLDLFFPRDINLLSPRVTEVVQQIHLEPGDVIMRTGEPAFSLYIVKNGQVEIFDEQGIVRIVREGEYFGERALLDDQTWHFSGRAVESTTLVAMPMAMFRQIVEGGGSLGQLFQKSAGRYQSREIIEAITGKLSSRVRSLPARNLMTRGLQTLSCDMRVREVLTVTRKFPHSSYPVMRDGVCVGVLNREDLYAFLKREETDGESTVSEMPLMSLPTIGPGTSVAEIVTTLIRSGANKLLVLEGGQLAGMITMLDLITAQGEAVSQTSSTVP